MEAQVVLRQIATAAVHLAQLRELSRRDSHPSIQRQPIACDTFQLEADPVIARSAFRAQDHGLAFEILDNGFHPAVVEQIADRHSTAYLRDLYGGAN